MNTNKRISERQPFLNRVYNRHGHETKFYLNNENKGRHDFIMIFRATSFGIRSFVLVSVSFIRTRYQEEPLHRKKSRLTVCHVT